jgi:hypothetical protein
MRIVRTGHYQRGIVGWFFKIVNIAFNLLMALAAGVSFWAWNEPIIVFIFTIWPIGALVLGLLSYFTRGKKVIIEDHFER